MKAFDIYYWQPRTGTRLIHVLWCRTLTERIGKTPVEVVMCSNKRATRDAECHEIILDQADGLDWPTICKCDVIHAVPRMHLKSRKGMITEARKAPLVRTIIAAHGWAAVL